MRGVTLLAGLLALAPSACGGQDNGDDALADYTDPGDGCQQVVSAIGYADDLLLALGQEEYQEFDSAVRSRLAAVEGTIALEVDDFPNRPVLLQARRVADLADRAQASEEPDDGQILALREYRRDAAQLVIDCAAAGDR